MRLFVTGATGFVGSAIVEQLLAQGNQVLGLARSEASARQLRACGVQVQMGSLEDAESLQAGIRATDGVIHTAFIHDFSRFEASVEIDRRAIQIMGNRVAGSQRPFIVTSGTAMLPAGKLVTEQDKPTTTHPRHYSDLAALALAERGVCISLVRLPPSVHGAGDHGFIPMLIERARNNGVSVYIEDGANRWPAVQRADAAALFCAAAEKALSGASLHAVGEQGIPFRAIASLIGERLGVPVKSVSQAEAAGYLGWMAYFAALDNPASSQWTQEKLGWTPRGSGLLEEMRDAGYFRASQ
ncbi:SDR family oxidoreductase [Pantoea osteomyelitidis]|uniref:SDR family oxidoreductase n=1 Tax=Pantoea osteomyelitidis TaxID=3230026 RepID=A0ABW7Q0H3_9GAMM